MLLTITFPAVDGSSLDKSLVNDIEMVMARAFEGHYLMQAFGHNQISVPRMGGIFDRCQVSSFRIWGLLTPETLFPMNLIG